MTKSKKQAPKTVAWPDAPPPLGYEPSSSIVSVPVAEERPKRGLDASGQALMPFPSEIILIIFSFGGFTTKEAAKLARVTRNSAWQQCVRPILWGCLTVESCFTGSRSSRWGTYSAVHAVPIHVSRKAQAICQNKELAKEVKSLCILGDDICKRCKTATTNLTGPLEAIAPYVTKITIAMSDTIAKYRLPTFIREIQNTEFKQLDTIEIIPNCGRLATYPELHVPPLNLLCTDHASEPSRKPVPYPGKIKVGRNKKIKVPCLTVGGFCTLLDVMHTAAYRLDFSYATTIALFEEGTRSIDMRTFKHVVSLDLQIIPPSSAAESSSARTHTLEPLKELVSLRDLHLWLYSTSARYRLPPEGVMYYPSVYADLHKSYPPNLHRLTFQAHTNSDMAAVEGCVRLWRNFAFRVVIQDHLDDLATAVTERLPKLTRLELPQIPRGQWDETRARVLSHPKLENWLAGLASDNKDRDIIFKLYS